MSHWEGLSIYILKVSKIRFSPAINVILKLCPNSYKAIEASSLKPYDHIWTKNCIKTNMYLLICIKHLRLSTFLKFCPNSYIATRVVLNHTATFGLRIALKDCISIYSIQD